MIYLLLRKSLNVKKIIILFFTWPVFLEAACQDDLPKFGSIEKADLELKSCSFDPDAPAMKFFEVEEMTFDIFSYGTRMKTEKRVRIKIFNERGFKYASVRIPYLSKRGIAKIKKLRGYIYNLDANGKIVKELLGLSDFFTDQVAENVEVVNFTFPHVRSNSVIEYEYSTIENDIIGISPWLVQDEIPVAYTSVSMESPARSGIIEKVFGPDIVDKNMYYLKNDQFKKTIFSKKNIPSYHPEPFMSSYKDNLLKVIFIFSPYVDYSYKFTDSTAAPVWKVAGKSFIRSPSFQNKINRPIPGTSEIVDSAKKIASKRERIYYIFETVKKRWRGSIEQTTKADSLEEAWSTRNATSTEANLILMNMLYSAGISCVPILISTRENGRVDKSFPSAGQFNGFDVIAFDSTKQYFLDASQRYQSFLDPPANILNRDVLVMSFDSAYWATVVDDRPLIKQSVNIFADINAEGKVEGTANMQYFDYAKAIRLDTTKKEDEEQDNFFDKRPLGLKIISSKQDLTDSPEDPLFETVEFSYEPQNTNEFYFINPQLFTHTNKNPFITEKRVTDIDLGCNQFFISTMEINLQGLFEIDHLPKNIVLRAPDSSFFYKAVYSGNSQKLIASQTFEIRRANFSKDEYSGIQDFFKRMYAIISEEIVLKKKK